MKVNNTAWNRVRWGVIAPFYDLATAPLQWFGFAAARRRAFALLDPAPGSRILMVGAGTGLDLQHLPRDAHVVATDLSPVMVRVLERRAKRLGMDVDARVVDGERLPFSDASFDHVVLHLILAVMPDPEACAREVARVLKPGGSVSVFDKFVPDGRSPSLIRRVLNVFSNVAVTDLTRSLGPILSAGGLEVGHRETRVLGLFTVATAFRSSHA